ncbi:hypothetical protein GCM10009808_26130 [Microbacterium sediminicola]|uniref:Uncharacterized protein n=1 Tax=Microbacterium sediminicola TaxID=415210 RepID=A0ABP4UN93_9MICO
MAVPFLVIIAGIVGALVWFAIPAVPMVIGWASGTAENAGTYLAASEEPQVRAIDGLDATAVDCRELYPAGLWNELTWSADVILTQTEERPVTAVAGLVDALAPTAARTCRWSNGSGEVVTTFAAVGDGSAGLAEASLAGQGFSCAQNDDVLTCTGESDAGSEYQVVAGNLWVSTVESGWQPDTYNDRLVAYLWG